MGSQTIYEVGHKSFGKVHYGMAYVCQYVLNNITQYIVGHTTNNAEMYALSSTDIILCIVIITAYYNDVIMGAMVYQITCLTIVYSTVYSGTDQGKHQSSASLAFVREFTGDWWIPHTNGQ